MTHTKNNRWFHLLPRSVITGKEKQRFLHPFRRRTRHTGRNNHVHTLTTPMALSGKSFYINSPITKTPGICTNGVCALLMITCRLSTIKQQVKLTKSCTGTVATAFAPHAELRHWYRKSLLYKKYPDCGKEFYPAISTKQYVVLVRKEDSLLLVHARNFKGTFNSLVAGFLETGETLEECVEREVKEETGLDVKNIQYFGNERWPYPSGLVGRFYCRLCRGSIRLQDDELSSGNFYTKNNLPELPRKLRLARK